MDFWETFGFESFGVLGMISFGTKTRASVEQTKGLRDEGPRAPSQELGNLFLVVKEP